MLPIYRTGREVRCSSHYFGIAVCADYTLPSFKCPGTCTFQGGGGEGGGGEGGNGTVFHAADTYN